MELSRGEAYLRRMCLYGSESEGSEREEAKTRAGRDSGWRLLNLCPEASACL